MLNNLTFFRCRSKHMSFPLLSIIQICSTTCGNVFYGDLLTIYGPGKNINLASPVKPQAIHANLIDEDGQMTITVNLNNNLRYCFNQHFYVGKRVRIIDFEKKKKNV